ncbi:MAG: nitronate monooxygenase [Verrucomicrobia bacterium]|nr:nitronate monooxygenase [Verrucomicrobiota bacterium]
MTHPKIIQGGMGVGVSNWVLARAVSHLGQLGVVSGTALALVLARRLQLGDPGGELRRALGHFPFPDMAKRILADYWIAGGRLPPFKPVPMYTLEARPALVELTVAANFVEVFLAREGHAGRVGINYLEKIQLPTLPSLFGAMLAGVDCVLMGAGIPRAIPGVMDRLAEGLPVELRLNVAGALPDQPVYARFDPRTFCGGAPPPLKRPHFLGIIASAALATTLARKSSGRVDGFIVEGPTAGGHNAPPRGTPAFNARGEPAYGPRDIVDLDKIRELGLPFWLAGSYASPNKLREALRLGATGVQIGTAFAFCEESGIAPDLKRRALALSRAHRARVFTDPLASPTGFPFKVLELEGTLSEEAAYRERRRVCDLGYLRQLYRRSDGTVGYRCPAEPVEAYVRKGGEPGQIRGRKCICNGLPAAMGIGQVRSDGRRELPLVTAGDDLAQIASFLKPGCDSYGAADVVARMLPEQERPLSPVRPGRSSMAKAMDYLFHRKPSAAPEESPLVALHATAHQGDANAQFNLGLYYSSAGGETPDFAQAARWYRQAADQDHVLAQFNLGIMFARGHGMLADDAAAAAWLRRAAEGGDAGGQHYLGVRCHRASLDPLRLDAGESRIEAYKWLHLAAAQGYNGSLTACQRLTLTMSRAEVGEGNQRAAAFVARKPAST